MTPRALFRRLFRRPRVRWSALSPQARWGYRIAFGGFLVTVCTFAALGTFVGWLQSFRGGAPPLPVSTMFAVIIGLLSLFILGAVCGLAANMLLLTGRARALRRLRADRFTLCPGCGYSLRQIPLAPRCPECARQFTFGGVVNEWARILPRRGRRFFGARFIQRHPEGAP